jgi:hypothetical protein
MLHETLLALLGCTGDVFVDAPAAGCAAARAAHPQALHSRLAR